MKNLNSYILFTVFFCFLSTNLFAMQLTDQEDAIKRDGPISKKAYVAGGITGTVLGFGSGHAIVGKYKEMGWLYTVGEVGFLGLLAVGRKKSITDTVESGLNGNYDGSNYALMLTGYVGFFATKLGEIFDIWNRPYEHNKSYEKIQKKYYDVFLFPTVDKEQMAMNLNIQF